MAQRLKYLFFIILLSTIPLGEIARVQFPNGAAVTATDIAVTLFVFVSIFNGKFAKPKLARPILIFSSVAIASLLINFASLKPSEFLISFLYLIRWLAYAGVYFSVLNFEADFKKKIPIMLLIIGAIVTTGGIVQYFLYPNLRNLYYLGWDEHLYRLFSSFLDPNFVGAFLVLYLLFVLGIFKKTKSLIYGLLIVITSAAIILTFSRSAYLMFFVGLAAFLFLHRNKKLIIGFMIVFLISILTLSSAGMKSEGTNLLRITSTQARLPAAQNAFTIFERNPILGVGFNAYEFASNRHGLSKENKFPNHSASGTDNSFLFVLATTGIVGLISYLYLWFRIMFLPSSKNNFSTVLISSSLALFVNSLFINSLFYTFVMLWMWILVGLSED